MTDKKKIAPDEVKIIAEVKTLYRADGHSSYYLKEDDCRKAAASAGRCTVCGAKTQYANWLTCDECRSKHEREKHAQKLINAPEWDGTYPVCLGEHFFWDEDHFLDHIIEYDIHPDEIADLYDCTPIYAQDIMSKDDLIQHVEESVDCEDAECPDEIEALIDTFIIGLNAIEKPIYWVGNKLVRITTEQGMMISQAKAEARANGS